MKKKIILIAVVTLVLLSSFSQNANATSAGQINYGEISLNYRNVTVYAPAVASTDEGYIGVISTITVTIQNNGSGRVFVDTLPLTQIDMQGSARLAVKVASALVERDRNCTVNPSNYDYFFVVRTSAPIIGGPSAGGIMTVATIALLENWTINNWTIMTGMINPDGSIGPVGGITYKIDAAYTVGAKRFLFPKGQGTYTEMVTQVVVEDGWRRTIRYPVTRNLSDYATDNYGMEALEVEDVNDALRYFTGYNFSRGKTDGEISTEDYVDSMKPLATALLDDARDLYRNASGLLNNSTIPNGYPFYFRNQITGILNDGMDRLEESQAWYDHGLYYSSTSKSFQSLIDSRFVFYACEYFNSNDEDQYILSLIDDVTSFYNEQSEEAKNAEINGMVSLQCVGAAQKRVSEAWSYLSEVSSGYDTLDPLGTLYQLAFAMERSRSVGWWLGISTPFNDTGTINNIMLENLALEYIEDAEQSTVYSTVILQEMGEISSYVTEAEELLESARDDLERDYPAAALFEALEALVKANLAIETLTSNAQERIDRARESASSSITECRKLGIEPVLAVSYYEYAESLVNESSYANALVYYKYSDIIAGVLSFTNLSAGGTSSRYVGTPEVNAPALRWNIFGNFLYIIFFALIGLLLGVGIGLIIGSIFSDKNKEKVTERGKPRSIDDYKKTQKDQYFSDQQIPRSIEDYYKKNK